MQRAAYDFIRMNHQHFATSVYSPGILKLKEKQPNDKTKQKFLSVKIIRIENTFYSFDIYFHIEYFFLIA